MAWPLGLRRMVNFIIRPNPDAILCFSSALDCNPSDLSLIGFIRLETIIVCESVSTAIPTWDGFILFLAYPVRALRSGLKALQPFFGLVHIHV